MIRANDGMPVIRMKSRPEAPECELRGVSLGPGSKPIGPRSWEREAIEGSNQEFGIAVRMRSRRMARTVTV